MEDHTDVLEMLVCQLRHMGYETSVAINCMQAISEAVGASPDLIILDLRLPDLNGVEVAAILKNHAETSAIPSIVYTGLESVGWRDRAFKAGAGEYLTKPTSSSHLREAIRRLTDERLWFSSPRITH